MSIPTLKELERRMKKSLAALQEELASLRTGRASTTLLENLMVDAYGSKMPLVQVANLSVPEPRMISVQVWDKGVAPGVEKTIRDSDLGLNPMRDGTLIRVPLPELTEERRRDLVKVVHKYAELARVAVRNIRRDGIDQLRRAEKNKELSQDDLHAQEKEIQGLTDRYVEEVDLMSQAKEEDILQV